MTLLVLILASSILGVIVALLWRWQPWKLFAAVTGTSSLMAAYVAEWPTASAVFQDVWSFLWFLFSYGLFFAPAVLAANGASAVVLLLRKNVLRGPTRKI